MKINFEKEVWVESSVDLTIEDVTNMLQEQRGELETRYDPNREYGELDAGRVRQLLGFMNAIHCCLSAITSEMVDSIEQKHRHMIFNALQSHADKWRTDADQTSAIAE